MKRILTTLSQKWPEYLLEMIVITAGILGAYSLNNWNDGRKDKLDETIILSNLNQEFTLNRTLIEQSINSIENSIECKIFVLELIGSDRITIENLAIDSLFDCSYPFKTYQPSESALEDIVQSGRLKLISNERLRLSLLKINNLQNRIVERTEKMDRWSFGQELPFLSKHSSFKQWAIYGDHRWGGSSNLEIDYHPLFQMLEFENILEQSVFAQQKLIERLKAKEVEINKIIEFTN